MRATIPENAVTVGACRRADGDGQVVVSASISIGSQQHQVWYKVTGGTVADGADALLAASLPIAMRMDRRLNVAGLVSPALLNAVSTIQDIYQSWSPDWRKVPVEATPRLDSISSSGRDSAVLFSGGVDSFYVLLKRRDEIGTLIFIHGFDISLDQESLRGKASAEIRRVASILGKHLVEVETNLRDIALRYVPWGYYHGAMLASVALLLAPRFSRVYIPASVSYATLLPWGSHPLLDPLWSTECTKIIHDGCDISRFERVVAISQSDLALQSLRVCWENRDGAYNCGRCEKCLRTMITLRILGVLGRCTTFVRPLSLAAVSRMMPLSPSSNEVEGLRNYTLENLRAAEALGTDHDLTRAIRESLDALEDLRAAEALGVHPALARGIRDFLHGRYNRVLWLFVRGVRRQLRRMVSVFINPTGRIRT